MEDPDEKDSKLKTEDKQGKKAQIKVKVEPTDQPPAQQLAVESKRLQKIPEEIPIRGAELDGFTEFIAERKMDLPVNKLPKELIQTAGDGAIETGSIDLLSSLPDKVTNLEVNTEEIQPKLKDLSLDGPSSVAAPKSERRLKRLRFCVQVDVQTSTSESEILNIECVPLAESECPSVAVPARLSGSSGNLGDVSRTASSVSTSPTSFIPPPNVHLARMSLASSSSSGSFPDSASALAYQQMIKNLPKVDPESESNLASLLSKKWKNTELFYHVLHRIAEVVSQGNEACTTEIQKLSEPQIQIPTNVDVPKEHQPSSSSKRYLSGEEASSQDVKRLRSASCIPFNPTNRRFMMHGVFAKWHDRKYYYADIVDILDNGRLQVVYLDKTCQLLLEHQIIRQMDILVGFTVMVTNDEGEHYQPGIVTHYGLDRGIIKYTVATNNGDFKATVGEVYFTEKQAKGMRHLLQSDSRTSSSVSSAAQPGCSGIQGNSNDKQSSETDDSSSKQSVFSQAPSHVTGCDAETKEPQSLNCSVKLKTLHGKQPKCSNEKEDSLLGPLDLKGLWFKDICFLITCTTRVAASSTEEEQTDNEAYCFSNVPFVRDRLVQQIQLGGGHVIKKFEDIDSDRYSETYLVTNRPCLTPTYLKCLTSSIRIVCHEWVVNCTKKRKWLPLYELPSGWSVEKGQFINMFDRETSYPFNGLCIKLAQYADENFYMFWSNICAAAGGRVSKFVGSIGSADVIVVENGFKNLRLDVSMIPLVSTSWVVQSIIVGEARPFNGHPSYSHLYEELDEY